MRRFRERNRPLVGLVTVIVTLALVAAALEFQNLPLVNSHSTYTADLANAASLTSGDLVTVHGVQVGTVTGMALDGTKVKVTFTVRPGVPLGSTTGAAVKVLSPIGTESLALLPSGPGRLQGTIPVSRTALPYTLVSALSGLAQQIQGYNTQQLAQAFQVGSADLSSTSSAETQAAFNGLARVSQILSNQQQALADIISQGAGLATTIDQKSTQLFELVDQGDIVLKTLEARQSAIKGLLDSTTQLSNTISSIITTDNSPLHSLLSSLESVSGILAHDSTDLGQAIPVLAAFSRYAANATGSGSFADVAAPALLLPDNLFAQCAAKGAFPSTNPEVGCRP